MSSFGPVAAHYDVLMSHVPYESWVDYYKLLLAQTGTRPKRLLDACCGTGIVAEILAGEGYDVTGFDISEPMIAEARSKGGNVDYHVSDAADLDLGKSFEGAYSFFDSLNYITDPDRLESAIVKIAAHLEPGGSFVFDVNTAYAFEKQMFDQRETRASAPIRYSWVGEYDPGTRLIKVLMDFERDGERFQETHHQRAYSKEELEAYLLYAGFEEVRVFDSYTLNPPRPKSDRLHFVAVLGSDAG